MADYILSKDFEKIYRTKEERIKRLTEFRNCFEDYLHDDDQEVIQRFTNLINICTIRIKYYQEV